MPNCTVIEPDLAMARAMLKHTTGLGVNLDQASDPVAVMRAIGALPEPDATGRKPGIMATLSWNHPRIGDFVACKRTQPLAPEAPLNNMNISVLVPRDQYANFRTSPLFDQVVEAAHACGDPGILVQAPGETNKATSPCGELWLEPNEVCNLGNINVAHFWAPRAPRAPRAPMAPNTTDAWLSAEFAAVVKDALVFLDRVRAEFVFGTREMRHVSERQARLGLGVMGFADLLRKAGVRYDSAEAVAWADHIGAAMRAAADEYRQENPSANPNRRLLTLAPTGGTSLITNASFSIEPFFHHAHSISPEQHVRVQSAWQRHVDNGVSKTVNLPFEATKEDVSYIYDLAHALDCKGVTVYRDGCRSAQPIATKRQ